MTWEIAIQVEQGKLRVEAWKAVHAREAGALPRQHGDPSDRALVAQARSEPLVLVTADPAMQA